MRAVVVHAPKDLRVENWQEDETLRDGEALVQVEAGGVCGSDLHYYQHGGFGTVRIREPMVLGHEVSGHILEVAADSGDLAAGQLVAINPSHPCTCCAYCLDGLPNHCNDMRFYGSAMRFPHVQGAFRERLRVKIEQCVAVPEGVTAAEAAMAEPLSVVLHAVKRAGSLLGKRVLVCGCGPIGVLSIMAARRAGALEILATDIQEQPLRHARNAGADKAINVAKDPDVLRAYAAGKGTFDAVFEASGAAPAVLSALEVIKPRGILIHLGLGGEMTLPMNLVVAKELDLRGSFRFHEEFHWAVELIAKRLIDVGPVITHSFPLEQAIEAFDCAGDRSLAMKTQITFS